MFFDFVREIINGESMILILKIFLVYFDIHISILSFTAWLGLFDTDLINKLYMYCITKKRYSFLVSLFVVYPESKGLVDYSRGVTLLTAFTIFSIIVTVYVFTI